MFENHVSELLREYLGEYLVGLDKEALRISVWKGDVVLRNLQLRADAFKKLNLPIVVKAGIIGTLRLKVPWNKLGQKPVVVELDRIYVLAAPRTETTAEEREEENKAERLRKREKLDDTILKWVKAQSKKSRAVGAASWGWFKAYLDTIIGNLQVCITNVHIRYEDGFTRPGHFFTGGVTLQSLEAFTVDKNKERTFVAAKALDVLRKAAKLSGLAVYYEPHSVPWQPPNSSQSWDDDLEGDMDAWDNLFFRHIATSQDASQVGMHKHIHHREYLVRPIDADLWYERAEVRGGGAEPQQTMELTLQELSLEVSAMQYHNFVALLDVFSLYRVRQPHVHLRPLIPIKEGVRHWWVYAFQVVCLLNRRTAIDPDKLMKVSKQRKYYVHTYCRNPKDDQVMQIEDELDFETILLFRCMSILRMERVQRESSGSTSSQSWGSKLMFGSSSSGTEVETGWQGLAAHLEKNQHGNTKQVDASLQLSNEEMTKLNEIMGIDSEALHAVYQNANESGLGPLRLKLVVKMGALVLKDDNMPTLSTEGRACCLLEAMMYETLIDVYHDSGTYFTNVAVSMLRYSTPEGQILQSGTMPTSHKAGGGSLQRSALAAKHVLNPKDVDAEMTLRVRAGACFVKLEWGSIVRILNFFQDAESAGLSALQVAATAQLAEVTKMTQAQLQASLLDMTKYVLDFEIDAPIVVFPVRNADNRVATSLIINLGHFVIRHNFQPSEMDPCQVNRIETSGPSFGIPESLSSQHAALFKTFTIRGSEISAAFVDGELDWPDNQLALVDKEEPPMGWNGALGSDGSLASSVSSEGSGSTIGSIPAYAPTSTNDELKAAVNGATSSDDEDCFEDAESDFEEADQLGDCPQRPSKVLPCGESFVLGRLQRNSDVFNVQQRRSPFSGWLASLALKDGFLPLLEQFKVIGSFASSSKVPGTKLALDFPCFGLHYSPLRNTKLMSVINSFDASQCISGPRAWFDPEYGCVVKAMYMGDKQRHWHVRWAAMHGAYLYITEAPESTKYEQCRFLGGELSVKSVLSEEVGELQHVVAICSRGVAAGGNVFNSADTILLRCSSAGVQEELVTLLGERSRAAVQRSWFQPHEDSYTIPDFLQDMMPQDAQSLSSRMLSSSPELDHVQAVLDMEASTIISFELDVTLSDLTICLSGRPLFMPEDHPSEEALVEIITTGVAAKLVQKLHESVLFAHMSAVVLNDLIGQERLAHSSNRADPAGVAPADCESVPIVRLKYASWSEQSPDYVQVDSALTLQISHLHFFLNRPAVASLIQFNSDLNKPAPRVGTQQHQDDNALHSSSELLTSPPSTPRGSHAQKLPFKRMSVPEFATPAPLQAASLPRKALDGRASCCSRPSTQTFRHRVDLPHFFADETDIEPDRERVSFHMVLEVEQADVQLIQEDKSTLGFMHATALKVDMWSRAVHMEVHMSLGNYRVADASFEENDKYRWILDLKEGETRSLVELRLKWYHTRDDKKFPGWDYSLDGQLSSIRIIFLYRFYRQLIAYFNGVCPSEPPSSCDQENPEEPHEELARCYTSSSNFEDPMVEERHDSCEAPDEHPKEAQWWSMKLNLTMLDPTLIVPRHSKSVDAMKLKMSSLEITNSLEWVGWEFSPPPATPPKDAAYLDSTKLVFKTPAMYTVRNGVALTQNLFQRHPDDPPIEVALTLRYAQYDPCRLVPGIETIVESELLHLSLSDADYALLTCVLTDNLYEEGPMPAWSLAPAQESFSGMADAAGRNESSYGQDGRSTPVAAVRSPVFECWHSLPRHSSNPRRNQNGQELLGTFEEVAADGDGESEGVAGQDAEDTTVLSPEQAVPSQETLNEEGWTLAFGREGMNSVNSRKRNLMQPTPAAAGDDLSAIRQSAAEYENAPIEPSISECDTSEGVLQKPGSHSNSPTLDLPNPENLDEEGGDVGEVTFSAAAEAGGQSSSVYTTSRIVVKVKRTRLEMCQGRQRNALAKLEVSDWWLVYSCSSNKDWQWYLTLPEVVLSDTRPNTPRDRTEVLRSGGSSRFNPAREAPSQGLHCEHDHPRSTSVDCEMRTGVSKLQHAKELRPSASSQHYRQDLSWEDLPLTTISSRFEGTPSNKANVQGEVAAEATNGTSSLQPDARPMAASMLYTCLDGPKHARMKLCIQSVSVLVDNPFIMAVSNFFVANPDENVEDKVESLLSSDIHLGRGVDRGNPGEVFFQPGGQGNVFYATGNITLTAQQRIVADGPCASLPNNELIFDGMGHFLELPQNLYRSEGNHLVPVAVVIVGANRTLRFRNVKIVNFSRLPMVSLLGPNARIVADPEGKDNVDLDPAEYFASDEVIRKQNMFRRQFSSMGTSFLSRRMSHLDSFVQREVKHEVAQDDCWETQYEIEAVGMEVLVPGSREDKEDKLAGSIPLDPSEGYHNKVPWLRARLDTRLLWTFVMEEQWMELNVHGLHIGMFLHTTDPVHQHSMEPKGMSKSKAAAHEELLVPCDIQIKHSRLRKKESMKVQATALHFSTSIASMEFLRNIVSHFQGVNLSGSALGITVPCDQFDLLWQSSSVEADKSEVFTEALQGVTFWRPKIPRGYALLGDCVTVGNRSPSSSVLAVSLTSGLLAPPIAFERVWSWSRGREILASLWLPIPPEGFKCLGCVTQSGPNEPSLKLVHCIRYEVVTSAPLGECLTIENPKGEGLRGSAEGEGSVSEHSMCCWCVENSVSTFMVAKSQASPSPDLICDLRMPLLPDTSASSAFDQSKSKVGTFKSSKSLTLTYQKVDTPLSLRDPARAFTTTRKFTRIWKDSSAFTANKVISFWRPVPPEGCSSFGDCVVSGHAMPTSVQVVRSSCTDLAFPTGFRAIWGLTSPLKHPTMFLWEPIPPDGYVALGYMVTTSHVQPAKNLIVCVRESMTEESAETGKKQPLWSRHSRWPLGRSIPSSRHPNWRGVYMAIWPADLELLTFVVSLQRGPLPKGRARMLNRRKCISHEEVGAECAVVAEVDLPDITFTLTSHARPLLCLTAPNMSGSLIGKDWNNFQFRLGVEIALWFCNSKAHMVRHLGTEASATHAYLGSGAMWECVIEKWQGAMHLDRADVTSAAVADVADDDDRCAEHAANNKESFSTTLRIEPASKHSSGINITLSHNMVDTLLRAYANVYPTAPEPPPAPPQADGKTSWSISSISKKFTSHSFKSSTVRAEPKGTQAPSHHRNTGSAALHAKAGFTLRNELGHMCYVKMLGVKLLDPPHVLAHTLTLDKTVMYTTRESTPTTIWPMAMGQELYMQPEFEPSSTPFNYLSAADQSPMPRFLLRIHILSGKGLKASAFNPYAVKQMLCSLKLQSGGILLHSANTNAVNVQEDQSTTVEPSSPLSGGSHRRSWHSAHTTKTPDAGCKDPTVEVLWYQSFSVRLHGWGRNEMPPGCHSHKPEDNVAQLLQTSHLRDAVLKLSLEELNNVHNGHGTSEICCLKLPLATVLRDMRYCAEEDSDQSSDKHLQEEEVLISSLDAWYDLQEPDPGDFSEDTEQSASRRPSCTSPAIRERLQHNETEGNEACGTLANAGQRHGKLHIKMELWKDKRVCKERCGANLSQPNAHANCVSEWNSTGGKSVVNSNKSDGGKKFPAPSPQEMFAWVGLQKDGPWSPLISNQGQVLTLNGLDVVTEPFQSELTHGVKLRSTVTLRNCTHVALEVSVHPVSLRSLQRSAQRANREAAKASMPSFLDTLDYDNLELGMKGVEDVYENQRYQPLLGWGSTYPGHMLPTDRKQWSRWDGSKSSTVFPDIEPPAGWMWETDWQLDVDGIADPEGWVYALDMKQFVLPHNANAAQKGPLYFVRRRRWVRYALLVDLEALLHTQAVRHEIGEMAPGGSLSVPIKFLLPRVPHDSSQRWELSLRPRSRTKSGWGENFSLAKGRFQRLAGAKNRPPGLILGAMPTETQVMFCELNPDTAQSSDGSNATSELEDSSAAELGCVGASATSNGHSTNSKVFWMAINCEKDLIAREASEPVEDVELTVHPPLIIESQLPCKATFKIYFRDNEEVSRMGRLFHPLEHGLLEAGGTQAFHGVNPQQALFLIISPCEGTWTMESPLMVYHPNSSKDLPRHLEMKDDTGRSLFVEVEHIFPNSRSSRSRRVVSLRSPFFLINRTDIHLAFSIMDRPNPIIDQIRRMVRDPHGDLGAAQGHGVSDDLGQAFVSRSASTMNPVHDIDHHVVFLKMGAERPAKIDCVEPGSRELLGCVPDCKLGLRLGVAGGGMSEPLWLDPFSDQEGVVNAHTAAGQLYQLAISTMEYYPPRIIPSEAANSGGLTHTIAVKVEPHIVVTNITGYSLVLKQEGVHQDAAPMGVDEDSLSLNKWTAYINLGPGKSRPLIWPVAKAPLVLKMSVKGAGWSSGFALPTPPLAHGGQTEVVLRQPTGEKAVVSVSAQLTTSVTVVVTLREISSHPSLCIDNRTFIDLRACQIGMDAQLWEEIPKSSTLGMTWERHLDNEQQLVLQATGDFKAPPLFLSFANIARLAEAQERKIGKLRISSQGMTIGTQVSEKHLTSLGQLEDFQLPPLLVSGYPGQCTVVLTNENGMQILRITEGTHNHKHGMPSWPSTDIDHNQSNGGRSEFNFKLRIDKVHISIIDHLPEELLFISVFRISMENAVVDNSLAFHLLIGDLQVDDQLTFSEHPVLFSKVTMKVADQPAWKFQDLVSMEFIWKLKDRGRMLEYPKITFKMCSDGVALRVHEPIVWRVRELVKRLSLPQRPNSSANLDAKAAGVSKAPSATVGADRALKIKQMSVSKLRAKLSFRPQPDSRPKGSLRGATGVGITFLANLDNAPLTISAIDTEDVYTKQTLFKNNLSRDLMRQLRMQVLSMLRNYAVLDSVSGVFEHMGAGMAALSCDKKFQMQRHKAGTDKRVDGLKDALLDGSEALAQGIYRGVTGVVVKPIEGAQKGGMEGFATGIGKGILGVVTQPASGVLDLVSKAAEGASNAYSNVKDTVKTVVLSDSTRSRQRLQLAILGDGILRPYNHHSAVGQQVMRLAQWGTYLGNGLDIWQTKGKFSRTDRYESHLDLDKFHMAILTNKRIMMLQKSSENEMDLVSQPSSVLWALEWTNLLDVELPDMTLRSQRDKPSPSRPWKASTTTGDAVILFHLKTSNQDRRILDSRRTYFMFECPKKVAQQLFKMVLDLKARHASRVSHFTLAMPTVGTKRLLNHTHDARARSLSAASSSKSFTCHDNPLVAQPGEDASASGARLEADSFDGTTESLHSVEPMQGASHAGSSGALTGAAHDRGIGQHRGEGVDMRLMGPEVSESTQILVEGLTDMRRGSVESLATSISSQRLGFPGMHGRLSSFAASSRAFVCIWKSSSDENYMGKPASLWRPLVHAEHVPFGDVLCAGEMPPSGPVEVCSLDHAGIAPPVRFRLVWRAPHARAGCNLTLWMPVPPPGHVALGCVAVAGNEEPSLDVVCCLHKDFVIPTRCSTHPTWRLGTPDISWTSKMISCHMCYTSKSTAKVVAGSSRTRGDSDNIWGKCTLWGLDNTPKTFLVSWGPGQPDIGELFALQLAGSASQENSGSGSTHLSETDVMHRVL